MEVVGQGGRAPGTARHRRAAEFFRTPSPAGEEAPFAQDALTLVALGMFLGAALGVLMSLAVDRWASSPGEQPAVRHHRSSSRRRAPRPDPLPDDGAVRWLIHL